MSDLPLVELTSAACLAAITAYVLFGGADFGGGVWDLLATGPRAKAQRALIADTISPIWEANHVWLILVVVILFTGFPSAYARISVSLHIPLTLMLVGVVLRGSAFTFRSYDRRDDDVQRRWGMVFAVASLVTPVLLGLAAGTVAGGGVTAPGRRSFTEAYVLPWLAPFPLAIGVLTLLLFAFLAAVYLTVEARDVDLAGDFRRRALWSGGALLPIAAVALWLARDAAPWIFTELVEAAWAPVLHLLTASAASIALLALWQRQYRVARTAAATQTALIVSGWGLAQWPWLLPPTLSAYDAAAPTATLALLVGALTIGAVVLFPALGYLFAIFGRAASGEQRTANSEGPTTP
ncbi:MAG TPA: cytochrome d ubiquinol oxidase subunit II [Gemmatimonadales bacterium]|nr:cytochrome d ubiquinol oxidase subunit II [Gemmatimonadales bacterium]